MKSSMPSHVQVLLHPLNAQSIELIIMFRLGWDNFDEIYQIIKWQKIW